MLASQTGILRKHSWGQWVIIWSIKREPLKTCPGGKRKLPGALEVKEGEFGENNAGSSLLLQTMIRLIEDRGRKKR